MNCFCNLLCFTKF